MGCRDAYREQGDDDQLDGGDGEYARASHVCSFRAGRAPSVGKPPLWAITGR
jgi:hypothetical protein